MISVVLELITLRSALFGALLFVVTFVISLAIVSVIMVKIPANYFRTDYSPEFLSGRHPAIRLLGIVGKNILGVLLVALGIVMSVPGVPGQGLLTILLGVMLLDFPGRRKSGIKVSQQARCIQDD